MTVHNARRQFLVALSSAAIARPTRVCSQGVAKVRQRIAWLSGSATEVAKSFADDFLDGMRGFGYVDSRDFEFVPRYAEGFQDRLPGLAQETCRPVSFWARDSKLPNWPRRGGCRRSTVIMSMCWQAG
jgi:hypothetical protein